MYHRSTGSTDRWQILLQHAEATPARSCAVRRLATGLLRPAMLRLFARLEQMPTHVMIVGSRLRTVVAR
jgi:hypothetical protein